ncbi:MAG: hypothetical protein LN410_03820 [Candidatus Thermoplasmatota archaeon]|nr:hypothetical protein [Candidatus Thermoplasmatota archaeon]
MVDAHSHLWTRRLPEHSASGRTALGYFWRDIEALPESLDELVPRDRLLA